MPVYEYRCVSCDGVFEQRRTMADADADVLCPEGHADVRRLLSVFAAGGRAAEGGSSMPSPAATPVRGCGGACACH